MLIYDDYAWLLMPKWKKDATEFEVHVTKHETRGSQTYLPKPVMEILGEPDTIKFVVKNNHIELRPGEARHDKE
jgi:hypothetical protein